MSSNVYVGNIPHGITADHLRERFCIYGNIVNVKILNGFAFVNYDNPFSAQKAILGEHESQLNDKKITVRLSYVNKHSTITSTSTAKFGGNTNKNDSLSIMTNGPPNKVAKTTNQFPTSNYSNDYVNSYGNSISNDQLHYTIKDPPVTQPKNDFTKPTEKHNDCEIIVVSEDVLIYAENIKKMLKECGLKVDLLFPKSGVQLGQVLASIANRGCLYAILITDDNQKFNSITINILHGIPQEHRNILIGDALDLINQDFETYKNGEPQKVFSINTVPKTEKHPENIQYLFMLLADCRQLTTLQYDRIIKYLQDKRDLQLKTELGESSDIDINLDFKKNELQNRILSILNKETNGDSMAVASMFDKLQYL